MESVHRMSTSLSCLSDHLNLRSKPGPHKLPKLHKAVNWDIYFNWACNFHFQLAVNLLSSTLHLGPLDIASNTSDESALRSNVLRLSQYSLYQSKLERHFYASLSVQHEMPLLKSLVNMALHTIHLQRLTKRHSPYKKRCLNLLHPAE